MPGHGEEIVDVSPAPVGAGYTLRKAARFPKALTKVATDERGSAALLVRDDNNLRVFDVDHWRTQLLLDPDHQYFEREELPRYMHPRGRVTLAFTRDARHIIVVDAACVVTLLDRAGNIVWRAEGAPPDGSAEWKFQGSVVTDNGQAIRVDAGWWRHLYTEADGNPVDEAQSITTWLDKTSGRGTTGEAEPPPASPAITYTNGFGKVISAHKEALTFDARFGRFRSFAASTDERRILVGTDERYFLLVQKD